MCIFSFVYCSRRVYVCAQVAFLLYCQLPMFRGAEVRAACYSVYLNLYWHKAKHVRHIECQLCKCTTYLQLAIFSTCAAGDLLGGRAACVSEESARDRRAGKMAARQGKESQGLDGQCLQDGNSVYRAL